MKLGGLQKISLIDYPGNIACTVFTVGCCFRCPFCHNPELVLPGIGKMGSISEKDFFVFLKQKKRKLDGVCITGGEPTIQPDIIKFIEKIKKLGYQVKLDSNGARPDVISKLIKNNLVDYIAMDIKNSLKNYNKACGRDVDLERIKLSVNLIKRFKFGYEFRTTVVPGVHKYEDFRLIAEWLKGSRLYILQAYQDQGKILKENQRELFKTAPSLDFNKIKKILGESFKKVEVRD